MSSPGLRLRRGKKTPETTALQAIIRMITLKGYLWLEPGEFRRFTPSQAATIAAGRGLKGIAWRSNTGGASDDRNQFVLFGVPGHPDITLLKVSPDRHAFHWIGLEVKGMGGRLNENQERFHALVNGMTTMPSIYVVTQPIDLEEILG